MESAIKGIGAYPNKPPKGADDNRRTACQFMKTKNLRTENERKKE